MNELLNPECAVFPDAAGGLAQCNIQQLSDAEQAWSYDEAFCRNRGLITPDEQQKIRNARVAIAGMGGVGGSHLLTLARLGFSKFSIADPDEFSVANFNRQSGATLDSLGSNKAAVMASLLRQINPDAEVEFLEEPVSPANVDRFLSDCAIYIDGLDFFAIDARRLVFRKAQALGMWSVTVAPLGFSAASLVFNPRGMSFDRYFDLHDRQSRIEQLVAFAVGLAPKATHRGYMDLSAVDVQKRTGPAVSAACHLASSMASTEATKIVLRRGKLRPVPFYTQYDLYLGRVSTGRLAFGNRDPRQRLKRRLLAMELKRRGLLPNE